MSIAGDIAKVVYQLRRMPDVDIERLSYELTDVEWMQLGEEMNKANPKALDWSYIHEAQFMGMKIRRPASNTERQE